MTKTYKKFETTIGSRSVSVETGKYCELANGSCIVTCGETVVMANVTMAEKPREGVDYFPLGVDFEEKMYAVGKFPGGFKKREGRPSDKAILTSRLIDRPLRPLFKDGFYNDVNMVVTALSVDPDICPEPFAMLASSIALSISDIPFEGPTGSVSVGMVDGKFIVNPTPLQKETGRLFLTVSGTDEAILMVEAGCKFVTEKEMLDGIMFAHEEIKKQVKFINGIVKEIGKKKANPDLFIVEKSLEKTVEDFAEKLYIEAFKETDRQKRQVKEDEAEEKVLNNFADLEKNREVGETLYNLKKRIVREKILSKGDRPDGRKLDEIRPIWCEQGVLPRVHGSAVFTRGQTQVLTTCTLGMISDAQKLDGLDDEESKRYIHHYNMPPYATGEAKMMRSTGRREIGHGALAEKALEPVLPTEEVFPYAIRTVSEVLSSNGSSSMASVCGSSMALMQAGVPVSSAIAGVAMGLIKDEKSSKIAVLTDIQGLEDFLGDMDFKVAGNREGITAIQMDIKIKGIDEKILKTALEQARIGRIKILDIMEKTIKKPNAEISKYAPKIIMFTINPDKIKDVIGSGGKVINKIIDETGVKIDIEDDGKVFIASNDPVMAEKAKQIILDICFEPIIGDTYEGTVVRIMDFGAFVSFKGKEGMIHISKLSKARVEKVEDVVKIGDSVKVKVIKIDDKGRIDLMRIEPETKKAETK